VPKMAFALLHPASMRTPKAWGTVVFRSLIIRVTWNNFGAFEGEDWLPNNPKRRLNNDLWI
jgi:hypothetical protein